MPRSYHSTGRAPAFAITLCLGACAGGNDAPAPQSSPAGGDMVGLILEATDTLPSLDLRVRLEQEAKPALVNEVAGWFTQARSACANVAAAPAELVFQLAVEGGTMAARSTSAHPSATCYVNALQALSPRVAGSLVLAVQVARRAPSSAADPP